MDEKRKATMGIIVKDGKDWKEAPLKTAPPDGPLTVKGTNPFVWTISHDSPVETESHRMVWNPTGGENGTGEWDVISKRTGKVLKRGKQKDAIFCPIPGAKACCS